MIPTIVLCGAAYCYALSVEKTEASFVACESRIELVLQKYETLVANGEMPAGMWVQERKCVWEVKG